MPSQTTAIIGYARASAKDRFMKSQVDALVAAGADTVYQENASGATQVRPRWQACLERLQPGDVLIVADLTRLGRNASDLSAIMATLMERHVGFKSLAEPWLDTTSADRQLIGNMFAALARYERSRLTERTKAGLDAAKARGRKGGRPRVMTPSTEESARSLRAQGRPLQEIADTFHVSTATIIRALARGTQVPTARVDEAWNRQS